MDFICNKKYIIIPASFNAANKRLLFFVEGKLVYDLLVALDFEKPEYNFPVNLERFKGKQISIKCDEGVELSFEQRDVIETDYSGSLRPLAHFTAKRGWINDPNGLTYYKGKYLMYFQHNPVATTWENMHWGFAESTDLIHWKEHEDVLFPDEFGTVFSGSGMVDKKNISGLKQGEEDPILFFYTCAGNTSEASKGQPFTQNLAYSLDGGKTLIKYEKPIIKQLAFENRDPKVIYYEPEDCYVAPIFLEGHEYAIFKSKDLYNWQEIQRLELSKDWECPDFYPLDYKDKGVKWIFSGASDRYLIGSFDGNHFTPETDLCQLNYGDCSYAAQSWSDLPGGRRVRTAFAKIVIPGMPFGCCMNLPQEMSLRSINGQMKLCATPVKEIESLYKTSYCFENYSVNSENIFRQDLNFRACDISLEIFTEKGFELNVYGLRIRYAAAEQLLRVKDCSAPIKGCKKVVTLRIICDTIYTELFAEEGSVFMGISHTQEESKKFLSITSEQAVINELKLAELTSFY